MSQEPIPHHWRELLRQIERTRDEELSCSECFDQVSRFVDLELAGRQTPEALPQLRQHLDQCRVCREEYEVLRDLVEMEAKGGASPPTDPPDAPE